MDSGPVVLPAVLLLFGILAILFQVVQVYRALAGSAVSAVPAEYQDLVAMQAVVVHQQPAFGLRSGRFHWMYAGGYSSCLIAA